MTFFRDMTINIQEKNLYEYLLQNININKFTFILKDIYIVIVQYGTKFY